MKERDSIWVKIQYHQIKSAFNSPGNLTGPGLSELFFHTLSYR